MSSEHEDIGYAIIGFVAGIGLFFRGFMRFRRKRLIQNTPTSTIRGLAMGLVEVYGRASAARILTSPFAKAKCVLYKFVIEEYRNSGKSGHWVTVASGDSFASPFWVDDGTGKIMVFPKGAEMIWPRSYFFKNGLGKQVPGELVSFLEERGIRWRGWFGQKTLQFSEWYILDGQMAYVLGSARKPDEKFVDVHKKELIKRLEALKRDPERMALADTNKDGSISVEEWDAAVASVEQELLLTVMQNPANQDVPDVFIGKGKDERVFIISDKSEKQIIQGLSAETVLSVFGGALLSLVTLAYLLFRFKMMGGN